MKNQTIKKLVKNILSGLLSQVVVMIMGIIVPRLVLVNFGSEMNGFLNSISQIYICLEVLEAGVGTATLQALLKYTGTDDKKSINGILSATTILYNRVGIIYTIILFAVAIIYPIAISSSIGYWTMFAIILMQGAPGACAYFIQSKFKLLLSADGNVYVQNRINLITKVLSNIAKIVLITLGCSVVVVQFAFFVILMLQSVIYKMYEKKKYRWVNYYEKPTFDAIEQRNSVFVHQISGLIFSNTDVLILTAFCGLKVVSVYSLYAMVLSLVSNIVSSFSSGMYYYLGQSFNRDRREYIKIHDMYETYYMGFVFALFTVAYLMILPFLKIYTRGVSDISYIDNYLPLLFVLIKFLEIGRGPSLNVLNFSEMFRQTKHHAIYEMIINIVVSLVGVYFCGIYGVLFGTIAALLYRGNLMIVYANKRVLKRSCWFSYRRWFACIGVFTTLAIMVPFGSFAITNYFTFALFAIPTMVVVLVIYFVVLSIAEREVFYNMSQMIVRKLKR